MSWRHLVELRCLVTLSGNRPLDAMVPREARMSERECLIDLARWMEKLQREIVSPGRSVDVSFFSGCSWGSLHRT
ncbi:hypothetical protein BN77_2587 [Rhizobium mesoamericanum STM3625]|uniref:Uncharacterized protein n=1 Tax=Rhizobium mesoamericanum STM3625 TaxID=1211777 RepID=K0PZG2_9HYPH|nr:hypothetical protein BN77_2587 [Rhizobium mesoamericanum STM3625]